MLPWGSRRFAKSPVESDAENGAKKLHYPGMYVSCACLLFSRLAEKASLSLGVLVEIPAAVPWHCQVLQALLTAVVVFVRDPPVQQV